MKFRSYSSLDANEVIAEIEKDIKEQGIPKEEADKLRAILNLSFDCVAACKAALANSDLPPELKIDAEISMIQSLLGTNILRACDMLGGNHDLSFHIQRFLNVTLNQLGYNATITNRSKQ